ncbi:hypothetical protein JZ751_012552 [Albula glossodonta]|uniref:Transmembrane protein 131-like n=1 Tax=Albula glossodonta TaxID=121402 RepID=A0A8T2P376_9TELE|nr:hypothetical protein JZ751_012552 [Albula glossodonta]
MLSISLILFSSLLIYFLTLSTSFYMGDSGRSVHFKPAVLDFGTQPLGLPRAETVYIHNPSQEVAVTVLSAFTSCRHLHVPPLHRRVFGVGAHPGALSTAQMKTEILLFPHIHSIKLTQTQENASNITLLGLLLECNLPENTHRQPQNKECFPITPQESCFATERLALQISLSERGERRGDLEKLKPYVIENIMVLFVMSSGGGGSREPRITVYMLNSGAEKLFVNDMHILSDVESSVEFKQVLLKASANNFTQVATLVCKGSEPAVEAKCSTQMSVSVLRSSSLKPYPGLGLTHRLFGYNPSTLFHVKPSQNGRHHVDLWLNNGFDFNFSVNEVTVPQDVEGALTVTNFSRPVTVPWGCWRLLSLRFNRRKLPVNVMTTVVLVTSIGLSLELPLRVRSGSKEGDVVLEASAECGKPCPLRLSETGRSQWQQTLLDASSSWRVDSSLAAEVCARWRNSKDLLSCSWPRLPVETGSPLEFGATPVNERKDSSDGAVRLLLQPWESREISVGFTPAEHKPVTSIILIRNNLTVFDMVMVRGHGARELLRVGGKLPGPGASLRFNVPQSTLMECRDGLRTNKPLFAIRKSFKVENAGELPLTVVSMTINGYKCQGFGFEVLQCRSFQLGYNSSSEITIAFTPDFTSSWVIRDLTLVTGRGSSFPFTLNVTLPHHMLPLCAQVVPGPSWEETFWVITLIFTWLVSAPPSPQNGACVTLIFTCCSLGGVCFMAFHQAQYILTEFTVPSPRANHSSVLPRDSSPTSPVCPNGISKTKGSCKTFVDSCNTSDKGKGKGSLAVAGGAASSRGQSSSRKSSCGAPAQPQKKHKVSLYYSKHKGGSATTATATEEEREEPNGEQAIIEPVCDNDTQPESSAPTHTRTHFPETEDGSASPVMFPMETCPSFQDSGTSLSPCSQAEKPLPHFTNNKGPEKREDTEPAVQLREDSELQRKLSVRMEPGLLASGPKGKKSASKSQRKSAEDVPCAPEHSPATQTERNRDPELRENRNANRTRNRSCGGKADTPKCGPSMDSPLKQLQNGMCPSRQRRKGSERRPQWESGSDSGSSSGSARGSRGSSGSWSSASSLEGERDLSAGARHHCAAPSMPRDSIQYSIHPAERDCYPTFNSSYNGQSVHTLYRKEPCHAPDPTEEVWSAPSVPLTNEFRYNATEPLPFVPQESPRSPYNGFPWSTASSQSPSSYSYCDNNNSVTGGNAHFQNSLSCQESQNVSYSPQSRWGEDSTPEVPSAWEAASCVGKGFYSGTRSLSPMSGLFGSIWTPQSEPYQNHFQQERCFPASPQPTYSTEPLGLCRPGHFSSFNPFGPHMNLDIWNSSSSSTSTSNRGSNSQLSNDSGYCGDV